MAIRTAEKKMFVVQVHWTADRVFQNSHTFPVHWSNRIRKMSCILESFTNSLPRLLCRKRKLFFYQLVPQCIADSPDAVGYCFFFRPACSCSASSQMYFFTTCEVPENNLNNVIKECINNVLAECSILSMKCFTPLFM